MAGAAKQRANKERERHTLTQSNRSSSGETSSSGKATSSARTHSASTSNRSNAPRRYDGADERNPATAVTAITSIKNVDLPAAAYGPMRGDTVRMPPRPKPSTLGQAVKIAINTFNVESFAAAKVYQFDLHIGNGAEKRGLIKKVCESRAVRDALGKDAIFDNNKLAWSTQPLTREVRVLVDLDAEQKRTPKPGKENQHRVVVRQTNRVPFETLVAYLEGKCAMDNGVLECINCLDHILRQTPSLTFTSIKRNFFARGQTRTILGNGVEAFKGVYQSMRMVHGAPKARLSVNVDVANGTFWTEAPLHTAAAQLCNARDPSALVVALRGGEKSAAGQQMKKFRKLHVIAHHRGNQEDDYCIERIIFQNAREYKFDVDGKMTSIADYFAQKYNQRIHFPDMPLVKMTRGKNTVLPMELLKLKGNQRYVFKLDERQTGTMVKFAATPPPQRWESIQHGLGMLDWGNDPVLRHYGLQINPKRTVVDGRLITAPKVQFGVGDAKPGTSGRWDLKGKKFLKTNPVPLKSWGISVWGGRRGGKPDKSVITKFVDEFVKIYIGHGGRVDSRQPHLELATGDDVGEWVTALWNGTGNRFRLRPQILVFILPDKDSVTYGRIKRSAECRYGVVSQCMQYAHVQKCQGQYISNVCMKFNAKLGGSTARAIGEKSKGEFGLLTTPTMIIGADVSHAPPGGQGASMAALTMSMDRQAVRYAATCETNGYRVEMITTDNIESMMKPLVQNWVAEVGQGQFPKRVLYIRDGVSEGQYAQVLSYEVRDMKTLLRSAGAPPDIPFLVVIGGKRHHVRFFPERGDKNGNPFPGTLVETGVTHPFENDFYLCGHAAIKGTARPVHYHVLLNEAKMPNEEIQTLLYEHAYQYMRATTPVSLHPAIYYAHIAALRAGPHDPQWMGSTDGGQKQVAGGRASGSGGARPQIGDSSHPSQQEFEKLLPMPNQAGILTGMWYI